MVFYKSYASSVGFRLGLFTKLRLDESRDSVNTDYRLLSSTRSIRIRKWYVHPCYVLFSSFSENVFYVGLELWCSKTYSFFKVEVICRIATSNSSTSRIWRQIKIISGSSGSLQNFLLKEKFCKQTSLSYILWNWLFLSFLEKHILDDERIVLSHLWKEGNIFTVHQFFSSKWWGTNFVKDWWKIIQEFIRIYANLLMISIFCLGYS